MNTKKQPPKNGEAPVASGVNPFVDPDFYNRVRDYTERDATFSKELKAIGEAGAGKQDTDARSAPSLEVLRSVVKKGLPLSDMLDRIVQGVEMGLSSKAHALFANAGVGNWRSLVARDCAQIQIDKPTEKTPAQAHAIFFLDAP
jgi:hypothetical protein